jgi:FeS assembly SUF system protein
MSDSTANPENEAVKQRVINALKTVHDPEIPVNIYELGLIYDIEIGEAGNVRIRMTLTSPACPVAGALPAEVETRVRSVQGVTDVAVELVWEPPWTPDRMSDAAKLHLNMDLDASPNRGPDNFLKLGRIP